MSKYGWTKGTGLGADESGIVNPLRVKVDKRRKKADADGGGWAEPPGRGKILGGKRKDENQGKFGKMSQVIVLRNMLESMADLQEEISEGLGQEIGEECGEKVSLPLQSHPSINIANAKLAVRPRGAALHRPRGPPGLHPLHRPSVCASGQCLSSRHVRASRFMLTEPTTLTRRSTSSMGASLTGTPSPRDSTTPKSSSKESTRLPDGLARV